MKDHPTPLDEAVKLLKWHTPEMIKLIEMTEPPSGGGALVSNFWRWCMGEGFKGHTGGTGDFPQSHGNYLCPQDRRTFPKWLKTKLLEKGIISK